MSSHYPTVWFFFFSSRRRHTRLTCDWSSDVCSSDLGGLLYSFDGTNWRLVLQQSETWVQSGAAFGERYYLGSGRDNRVWAFNGRDLVEVFAGYSPHGSRVRGLVAFAGRLYAGA